MNEGYAFEELELGQTASFAKTVTEADILLFAGISGDFNPVHINAESAARTAFGERIAHGMLCASFISTVLGTRLPGPGTIYMSQSLRFLAPVRIGRTVHATVTITALDAEKCRATLRTVCTVDGTAVIDGEALVKVPSRR